MPDYLTMPEVAEMLRRPIETVRWWRKIGEGPHGFKIGGRVLYARADVEAFIEEARRASA